MRGRIGLTGIFPRGFAVDGCPHAKNHSAGVALVQGLLTNIPSAKARTTNEHFCTEAFL